MALMLNAQNPAARFNELARFNDLDDIITWSGLNGDPSYAYSEPGSLVYLLAGEEFPSIDAVEFATITPDDYEEALRDWTVNTAGATAT